MNSDETTRSDEKPGDYLKLVKTHIRNGYPQDALPVIRKALVAFPDDPVIFSYFGYLQAVVDKKYRTGIDNCKKAIVVLEKKGSFREEVFYPVLYLNLGMAYLASGMKKEAVDAFTLGLGYNRRDKELTKVMQSLGTRKTPPITFLDRGNPLNKIIGKVVHKPQPSGKSRARA